MPPGCRLNSPMKRSIEEGERDTGHVHGSVVARAVRREPEREGPDDHVAAGYKDESADEEATERDLGYDFQMPNPLDRLLGDVVTAITTIAQTFDPTQSNTELLRTLRSIGLTELGIEDAAAAVERNYHRGMAATAAAAGPGGPNAPAPGMNPGADQGEFSAQSQTGAMSDDSQDSYGGGDGRNPAGAVASSQSPEQVAEAADRHSRSSKRGSGRGWHRSTRC